MKGFPVYAAFMIVALVSLLVGIRLVSPRTRGLNPAPSSTIVESVPDRVLLGPLKRGTEPVVVPRPPSTVLLSDPQGTLDHFYLALWRTEKREQGAVTRITHYGDSAITGDLISGDVRFTLQARFGNAGDGFMLIEKPWAWYQHRGVDLFGLGWVTVTAGQLGVQDGMFGLGGGSFTGTSSASSRVLFHRARYSQFEVWFLRQPGGGTFTLSANGQILGSVDTSGDSKSSWALLPFVPTPLPMIYYFKSIEVEFGSSA